jgi:hypothetical protein
MLHCVPPQGSGQAARAPPGAAPGSQPEPVGGLAHGRRSRSPCMQQQKGAPSNKLTILLCLVSLFLHNVPLCTCSAAHCLVAVMMLASEVCHPAASLIAYLCCEIDLAPKVLASWSREKVRTLRLRALWLEACARPACHLFSNPLQRFKNRRHACLGGRPLLTCASPASRPLPLPAHPLPLPSAGPLSTDEHSSKLSSFSSLGRPVLHGKQQGVPLAPASCRSTGCLHPPLP